MTRDQALTIAKRIMRRIENDKAIHLDSIADELVIAGAITKSEPSPYASLAGPVFIPSDTFLGITNHVSKGNALFQAVLDRWDA